MRQERSSETYIWVTLLLFESDFRVNRASKERQFLAHLIDACSTDTCLEVASVHDWTGENRTGVTRCKESNSLTAVHHATELFSIKTSAR